MIEIAFDENTDHTFKEAVYPVIDVPALKDSDFSDYLLFALNIVEKYSSSPYLIVKKNEEFYSSKKIAFAFFVASCFKKTDLQCLVLKVKNRKEDYESYKPYIAMSIGLKYAFRLINEPSDVIYRELRCLNYLHFEVKENYADQTIAYYMKGEGPLQKITTYELEDSIVEVSVLKTLSLADVKRNIELIVHIQRKSQKSIKETDIVDRFLKKIVSYIKI